MRSKLRLCQDQCGVSNIVKMIEFSKESFIAEKTSDEFIEVKFTYKNTQWIGALPLKLRYQGYEISLDTLKDNVETYYNELNPINYKLWKIDADKVWQDKTTQTYKVFNALATSKWECRVCGPVPQVNPQAASRLRDIKKRGFIIATKRQVCPQCNNKSTIHDILVMIKLEQLQNKPELRKPISSKLAQQIYKTLGGNEAVFEQKRTQRELIIDHKFPSQRWSKPESDNVNTMNEKEIKKKFQLLSNQTNLLKSRECDRCLFEGKRGKFLGIKWYYYGDENWEGNTFDNEQGCIGCPWYDILEWKKQLSRILQFSISK